MARGSGGAVRDRPKARWPYEEDGGWRSIAPKCIPPSRRGEYASHVGTDVELGKLLETHKSELKTIAEAAGSGNQEKLVDAVSTLVVSLATGNPLLGLLAPLGRKGIARAFGSSVNVALTRELVVLKEAEERRNFLSQIDEVLEALVGQALIQLVRAQHNVRDEILEVLGGVRRDLEAFRKDFAERVASASETVTGDRVVVRDGALGIRVCASTTKRVVFQHMTVMGTGSVGIDLE